jgi:hypothetical protein
MGNTMGAEGGLCYGLSFSFKKITKKNYFFGVDIGYEILRSRAEITKLYEFIPNPSGVGYNVVTHSITGIAYRNNTFLNTYQFLGYRWKYKKINFDLTVGMDIGYFINTKESGFAKKSDGTNYTIFYPRLYKYMDSDFRPRFQLSSSYKKFGLYFGYAYGISDYLKGNTLNYGTITSQVIRFGVIYKLK